MLRSIFTAAVLLVGFSIPVYSGSSFDSVIFYDDGDSYAVWQNRAGGTLIITASFRSRNGCASYVDRRLGPPEGISRYPQSVGGGIQVTFVLEETAGTSVGNCSGPVGVREIMVVEGRITESFVEIFYVSSNGRLLKRERISIRG